MTNHAETTALVKEKGGCLGWSWEKEPRRLGANPVGEQSRQREIRRTGGEAPEGSSMGDGQWRSVGGWRAVAVARRVWRYAIFFLHYFRTSARRETKPTIV